MDRYVGLSIFTKSFLSSSASIQFSGNMEQRLRELTRSHNESIDREMGILQGLALRAGQQGSSSERGPELGSVAKRGEEDSGDEGFLGDSSN